MPLKFAQPDQSAGAGIEDEHAVKVKVMRADAAQVPDQAAGAGIGDEHAAEVEAMWVDAAQVRHANLIE